MENAPYKYLFIIITDSFVYLGVFGNNLGGAEEDIRSRLGKTLFFIDFQRCGEHVNFAEKLSQISFLSCCIEARHGE